VAYTGLWIGDAKRWYVGPELGIRRDFGLHWGVGLLLSVPGFNPVQGPNNTAAALDLGPTFTFVGRQAEFGITAGATGFVVISGGGLLHGGVDPFTGGHATAWITDHVGATISAKLRVASGAGAGAGAYPSLSAGLAVRF
jgi:hypothetical protein